MGKIQRCCVLYCKESGTERAHVHINKNRNLSLVMFCKKHNLSQKFEYYPLKKSAAIVPLPECNCCSCSKYEFFYDENLNNNFIKAYVCYIFIFILVILFVIFLQTL
jgi:hypothetical protein